jgi:hypothetical protein
MDFKGVVETVLWEQESNTKIPVFDGDEEIYFTPAIQDNVRKRSIRVLINPLKRIHDLQYDWPFQFDNFKLAAQDMAARIKHWPKNYIDEYMNEIYKLEGVEGVFGCWGEGEGGYSFQCKVNLDAYRKSSHAQEDLYGF